MLIFIYLFIMWISLFDYFIYANFLYVLCGLVSHFIYLFIHLCVYLFIILYTCEFT